MRPSPYNALHSGPFACHLDGGVRRCVTEGALIEKCLGCSQLPESHCYCVGTGVGSSVTHHIREASPAHDARGIIVVARVGNCRDHGSITVDINIACRRSGPSELRCIYSPYTPPSAGEDDVFSG